MDSKCLPKFPRRRVRFLTENCLDFESIFNVFNNKCVLARIEKSVRYLRSFQAFLFKKFNLHLA